MSVRPNVWDWCLLVLAVGSLVTVGIDIWQRQKAGRVLLDLGGVDGRNIQLLIGVLFEAGALYAMFVPAARNIFFSLFALGFGLVLITGSQRRFQIREAGLLGRGRTVIPWRAVAGYEISSIGTLSLKLQSNKSIFFCDLRPEIRPEATRILAVKCSQPLQPEAPTA